MYADDPAATAVTVVVGPWLGRVTPPALVLMTNPVGSTMLNSPVAELSMRVFPPASETTSTCVTVAAVTGAVGLARRTVGLPLARSTPTGLEVSFRNTEP